MERIERVLPKNIIQDEENTTKDKQCLVFSRSYKGIAQGLSRHWSRMRFKTNLMELKYFIII